MESTTLLARLSEHYLLHLKKLGGIEYTTNDFPTAQSLLNFDGLVLKPRHRSCDDCNRIVKNPGATYQVKNTRKKTYWIKQCNVCSKKTEINNPTRQGK
jgi:hypothetical protein